jgi:hypothetical protein
MWSMLRLADWVCWSTLARFWAVNGGEDVLFRVAAVDWIAEVLGEVAFWEVADLDSNLQDRHVSPQQGYKEKMK